MNEDRRIGQRAGIRWAIAWLRKRADTAKTSADYISLWDTAMDLERAAKALRNEDADDITAGLEPAKDRIDYDDAGNLDDVVINSVDMFHLEYMSNNCVWLACYRPPERGGDVVFWLNAKGKITGKQGED